MSAPDMPFAGAPGSPTEGYWEKMHQLMHAANGYTEAEKRLREVMIYHRTELPDLRAVAKQAALAAESARKLALSIDALAKQAESENEKLRDARPEAQNGN